MTERKKSKGRKKTKGDSNPCPMCFNHIGGAIDRSGERWAVCDKCLNDIREEWLDNHPIEFPKRPEDEPKKGYVE